MNDIAFSSPGSATICSFAAPASLYSSNLDFLPIPDILKTASRWISYIRLGHPSVLEEPLRVAAAQASK